MLKNDKKPKFDKKKPKWFKNKKTEFDTTNARASEVSGPTRIRFCAKYQKNQHYGPEDPKKPDFDRDSMVLIPYHIPYLFHNASIQIPYKFHTFSIIIP